MWINVSKSKPTKKDGNGCGSIMFRDKHGVTHIDSAENKRRYVWYWRGEGKPIPHRSCRTTKTTQPWIFACYRYIKSQIYVIRMHLEVSRLGA
jgi:hypothetical protein